MANDNQTALQQSIRRKKDRMNALEIDLLGHHIFGGREAVKQEVLFLKHEIAEDEKLLPKEIRMVDRLKEVDSLLNRLAFEESDWESLVDEVKHYNIKHGSDE